MKKLAFLFLISIIIFSCSVSNDDGDNGLDGVTFEFLPIENVELPESFVLNETYQIAVTYFRPSSCHSFNDFYYQSNDNERTIAVINQVINNSSCEDFTDNLVEVSFNFVAKFRQTYVFKIWKGLDENENDLYYIVEVPVI